MIFFFADELERVLSNTAASIIEREENGPLYKVKSSIQLHLFVTHPPCGDCSIDGHSFCGAKPVSDPQGRESFNQTKGVLRMKSSHSNIESEYKTLSMSCSDKICKWNCTGLQGALLSKWIPQVVGLESLTIAMDVTIKDSTDDDTEHDYMIKHVKVLVDESPENTLASMCTEGIAIQPSENVDRLRDTVTALWRGTHSDTFKSTPLSKVFISNSRFKYAKDRLPSCLPEASGKRKQRSLGVDGRSIIWRWTPNGDGVGKDIEPIQCLNGESLFGVIEAVVQSEGLTRPRFSKSRKIETIEDRSSQYCKREMLKRFVKLADINQNDTSYLEFKNIARGNNSNKARLQLYKDIQYSEWLKIKYIHGSQWEDFLLINS